MESKRPSDMAGKPIRCRAAVARKAGEPLVVEEIDVLPPKAWEVRIKILCTSLCHSDVTFWERDFDPVAYFPRIFGHEAAGIVESVGELVEEVKPGDMVVPVFQRNCGECKDCLSPKGNACSKFPLASPGGMPCDGTTRFLDVNGSSIHHFFFVSSFSQYTVVDIAHVVKIRRDFPVDKACLLSCGVTTGVGAVWKIAEVEEGSIIAIFGLGVVGLAVAEGARLRGVSKIIGVDINPQKFELGKKFGVTDFINPNSCTEKTICQVIQEISSGGVDYCFECIGLASLMQDAVNSSRPGCGKTIILGLEKHGTPLSINTYDLLRGKSVTGCLFGGLKPKSDIPILAQKYLDKKLHLDEFISHEIELKDINSAFEMLQYESNCLRCIIWMHT